MTQPYDDVVIEEHRWIVNSGVSDICTKPKSKRMHRALLQGKRFCLVMFNVIFALTRLLH